MKIFFRSVSVRNFLSFGDEQTIFDYKTGIHVVTGQVKPGDKRNGAGKSTLLVDSIIFSIYGKTMRKVKKESIINKMNARLCVVTCEFDIGKKCYKIERGIKPNTLKVWESDDHTFEEGSDIQFDSMKNTQDWIDRKVNISYESFINMIVLNINHSKPFLEMDLKDKRPVLVDLINLGIYSKMSEVAKKNHLDANGEVKAQSSTLKTKLDNHKLNKQKRESLLLEAEKFEDGKRQRLEILTNKLQDKRKELSDVESKLTHIDYKNSLYELKIKYDETDAKIKKIQSRIQDCQRTVKDGEELIIKLKHEDHCPLCKTPTTNPLIQKYLTDTDTLVQTNIMEIEALSEKKKSGSSVLSKINEKSDSIREEQSTQEKLKNTFKYLNDALSDLENNIKIETERTLDIDNVISDDDIQKETEELKKAKITYDEVKKDLDYNKFIRSILGEDGIGKYVIKKVLPFLNQKVNHYLNILGSDYTLKFDQELNENLVSKNMEEREYASFSGGEKKRIDLSILMSMMDVAKSQNSVDTNILILDEVLDTSMDNEGVESFMWHLKDSFAVAYPDKCVYIITHRKEIGEEVYDSVINLVKENDFTRLELTKN